MPKKAVAIFFLLAFLGAVLFVYFTFPRTKDEIPTSNNQRPFPSAPTPGPNGVPVPETMPHPNTPKLPPGPTLHVMAWASGDEVKVIEAEAESFEAATGRRASLTISSDAASYRHDLQEAMASGTPPDVCLINSRDFCGLNPALDLVEVKSNPDAAPRSVAAFTVGGEIKAVPGEFSVDVLFYNETYFDQAAIGYPGPHWTWDTMEAITRAVGSLKLKDGTGQPIYPLELPADFDFWNVLCGEAGQPALDLDAWNLSDASKVSQMRALDILHRFFQDLAVTAPLPKSNEEPGRLFAQQRSALLIAPSEMTAFLPTFRHDFTLLPSDIARASLARVNGWAVTSLSSQRDAASALAAYLAWQPVHAGWRSVQKPTTEDGPDAVCYQALGQAIIPRIDAKSVQLVQFIDQQIKVLVQDSTQKEDAVFARIQSEYHSDTSAPTVESGLPKAAAPAAAIAPGL